MGLNSSQLWGLSAFYIRTLLSDPLLEGTSKNKRTAVIYEVFPVSVFLTVIAFEIRS